MPLLCNHECPIPCRQNCRPCQEKCNYHCGHTRCGKQCGEPCTTCKEPCRRKCQHQQCKRKCGQVCNVLPCKEKCDKQIKKCGHACVGYCGDPCPILCRICDEEELTETFLGNEDEEDAIYIMLEDCKHIFESSDLERWMELDGNEIKAKVCPRCKTTITKSTRFNNILKNTMTDLMRVKRKSYGYDRDNITNQNLLIKKVQQQLSRCNKLRKYTYH